MAGRADVPVLHALGVVGVDGLFPRRTPTTPKPGSARLLRRGGLAHFVTIETCDRQRSDALLNILHTASAPLSHLVQFIVLMRPVASPNVPAGHGIG